MVEKMQFERAEERKHVWRSIFIIILGIMLGIGYVWQLTGRKLSSIFPLAMIQIISILLLVVVIVVAVIYLIDVSDDHKKKNVEKFEFNAKVDELLNDLGDKEIKVKLKRGTNDFSPEFENAILNPEITYYVRKKDPKNIEMVLRKKNEKISCWDTSYEFLFKHYELIYSEWVRPKEEA